jgi:serine phosphatase RsbU (regulator of sigma subunit)
VPHRTVSRRHAEIEVSEDGEACRLSDLGSHNGTAVNGEPLADSRTVGVDDRIAFGQTEFRLTDSEDVGSATSVPVSTTLSDQEPENSVYVSINEALQPLPTKITERPELLPTMFEMAKMLVQPDERDAILHRSLELIARVIPAQRLAVLFVSHDQDEVFTAATLATDDSRPDAFRLSRTIVREIMENKNAILIGRPEEDPRFAQQHSIIVQEIKSALAVPLFDQGKVLGILYADTADPRHRYDDDHLRVLATFGNIIAAKLLSYALIAEREEKQIVQAELRRASAIQQRLLVTEAPVAPGWEAHAFQEQSRQVGGDLFDLACLKDDRLLVLLADVSGKGMGAALLMSNILASFRILYNSEPFDLCRAVEDVSTQVWRFSDPGDFATLFIAVAEKDGTLHYVNAGHNQPLLVRTDGSVEKLEASGIMIGAFDMAEWTQGKEHMEPGDHLVIFSDGVTEAESSNGQFGDARTTEAVVALREHSPEELIDELVCQVREFVGDTPQSDDITLVALKRSET